VLSRHVGREVRYEEESVEEAYRSREKYGAEKWQVDAWVSTYTAIRAGEFAVGMLRIGMLREASDRGAPPATRD
jgi:hypothetical protein